MFRIGIDLGGTKIEGVLLEVAPGGALVEKKRERVPTLAHEGYPAILGRVASMVGAMAGGLSSPYTLGIGTPGATSRKTGLLRNSNTVCLNGMPVEADLRDLIDHPFTLENDANCFALAEALHGAGRGYPMVFGVIMGTGCGGGLVINGQTWTGPMAVGGEWGHMQLDPQGPPCYCGQRGCVETYISGGGLEKRWVEAQGEKKSLAQIVAASRAGDAKALAFMNDLYGHFGRALANLINALDPSVVVLGGGVSNIDGIYSHGIAQVGAHCFTDHFTTPILKNQLGDSAGVLGAALIGI